MPDLAEEVGVSTAAVWKWENDRARPGRERLQRLAHALYLTKAELIDPACDVLAVATINHCRQRIATASGVTPAQIRIVVEPPPG